MWLVVFVVLKAENLPENWLNVPSFLNLMITSKITLLVLQGSTVFPWHCSAAITLKQLSSGNATAVFTLVGCHITKYLQHWSDNLLIVHFCLNFLATYLFDNLWLLKFPFGFSRATKIFTLPYTLSNRRHASITYFQ